MSILAFGGAGYIAAHAVHQLAAGDENGLIKNIGVNSDEFERLADIKKRQTR